MPLLPDPLLLPLLPPVWLHTAAWELLAAARTSVVLARLAKDGQKPMGWVQGEDPGVGTARGGGGRVRDRGGFGLALTLGQGQRWVRAATDIGSGTEGRSTGWVGVGEPCPFSPTPSLPAVLLSPNCTATPPPPPALLTHTLPPSLATYSPTCTAPPPLALPLANSLAQLHWHWHAAWPDSIKQRPKSPQ